MQKKTLEVFYTEGLYVANKDKEGNITIERQKINRKQLRGARWRIGKLNDNGFDKKEQNNTNP